MHWFGQLFGAGTWQKHLPHHRKKRKEKKMREREREREERKGRGSMGSW